MDIYFIQEARGPIKIGRTKNDVQDRLRNLQTANPYKLTLLTVIPNCKYTEKYIHILFDEYRLHGEWFEPAPQILEFMNRMIFEHEKVKISNYKKEPKIVPKFELNIDNKWSKEDEIKLMKLYDTFSIPELARLFNRPEQSILGKIERCIYPKGRGRISPNDTL